MNQYSNGFYNKVFITEASFTISHIRLLLAQYRKIDDSGIQASLLELITVHYGKLFLGSNKAYKCDKNYKHKLQIKHIEFTSLELSFHKKVCHWRNTVVAHLDQDAQQIDEGFVSGEDESDLSGMKIIGGSEIIYSTYPKSGGFVRNIREWDLDLFESLITKVDLYLIKFNHGLSGS